MDVLLTGGTGYIGSVVLTQLREAGHTVRAVVRSERSAEQVTAAGATAVQGDLTDRAWLTGQLREVDGAIHTASPGDATSPAFDRAVVASAVEAFARHEQAVRPHERAVDLRQRRGPGRVQPAEPAGADRLAPGGRGRACWTPTSSPRSSSRPSSTATAAGCRTCSSTGPADGSGRLVLIGDGSQHWGVVHVDDVAALYLAVLESGRALGRVLGGHRREPDGARPGEATGSDVVGEPVERPAPGSGEAFADALLLDQQFVLGGKAADARLVAAGPDAGRRRPARVVRPARLSGSTTGGFLHHHGAGIPGPAEPPGQGRRGSSRLPANAASTRPYEPGSGRTSRSGNRAVTQPISTRPRRRSTPRRIASPRSAGGMRSSRRARGAG